MLTIESRLAALEKSVRRWRYATVGLVLVLAVGGTVAAALQPEIPDVIKARRIEVVDVNGQIAVELKSSQLGGFLAVWGAHPTGWVGHQTTIISHTDGGSGALTVSSKDRKDVIIACATVSGDGMLKVKSKDGKELIYAGGMKSGNGGMLAISNKTGEDVVTLDVDEYGNGKVGAWNRKGKGRTLTPGP